MWRYFLRMALAVVSITTSQIAAAEENCMLLCDQVKFPGPKNSPYSIIQCEHKQICMQKLNYTTELVKGKRKNTIRFLHRHCADPRACIAHCRSTVVNDEPIVSCVSCMSATFEYEGKKIAEKICHDSKKPIIDPFDNDDDETPQTDERHVEPEVKPDNKERPEKGTEEKEKAEKEKVEKEKADTEKQETEETETEKPETEETETEKPETEKPETEKPETEQPETEKPATEKPETEKPETEQPETEKTDEE